MCNFVSYGFSIFNFNLQCLFVVEESIRHDQHCDLVFHNILMFGVLSHVLSSIDLVHARDDPFFIRNVTHYKTKKAFVLLFFLIDQ